ncbi:hypothetical protein E4U56_007572 [Claviceps arundinis]|uniref:Uncharacterized protein n=1 Tax=Claviceps arundinis TaxID=1623583 RepID=A0A9P7MV31_9HYPO|nr:hypothetical protein E4U56_007572 [Claviceps arundinis]
MSGSTDEFFWFDDSKPRCRITPSVSEPGGGLMGPEFIHHDNFLGDEPDDLQLQVLMRVGHWNKEGALASTDAKAKCMSGDSSGLVTYDILYMANVDARCRLTQAKRSRKYITNF